MVAFASVSSILDHQDLLDRFQEQSFDESSYARTIAESSGLIIT